MTGAATRWIDTQVVVVGAGPVGLMLAAELLRARVPVVVVELLAEPMTESRASQLNTLTAEMLHERGFDSLLAEAAAEPRAHLAGLAFELSGLDSDYAGNWKVPQYRTESVLGERVERLGATVLRAHRLTGIDESADRVACTVRGPAGELRIRARYLVGCDGARSTVRTVRGFGCSATVATKELLRADVTGIDVPRRSFERLEAGFAVAGARDGVTRVMVHAFGQRVTAPPRFGDVVRLWQRVTGEDISVGEAIWVDSFDNARGQADAYRLGRVLLAGDAAHWHMPIGGQSLNVGLQDAVNLGWKLAGSVNGWASDGLLDSYHDERHPIAARVLDYVAGQEALMLGGAEIEPLRAVLAELIGLGQVRDHLARAVTGLDDRYGANDSPLVGRRIANLRLRRQTGSVTTAGSLLGPEPVVLRFPAAAGRAAPAVALPGGLHLRTIHAAQETTGLFSGIDTILLRPDGYVAWAGADDAELDRAVRRMCRVAEIAR